MLLTRHHMLVSRANLNGGRPLKGYPYDEDPETGLLGFKLGYCSGCNEPIMIRSVDVREVVKHFGDIVDYEPPRRLSLKKRIILWLGGRVE